MKRILFSSVVFCLSVCFLASLTEAGELRGRRVSGPALVAPGDNQDLSGKQTLEFRWSPEGDRSNFDHYDFRLYEGHETVEAGLILQRDVPAGEVSAQVDTAIFKEGKTYAWSVRQVGARKSRSSYSVFKVIKPVDGDGTTSGSAPTGGEINPGQRSPDNPTGKNPTGPST